jgi:hypothetical protein
MKAEKIEAKELSKDQAAFLKSVIDRLDHELNHLAAQQGNWSKRMQMHIDRISTAAEEFVNSRKHATRDGVPLRQSFNKEVSGFLAACARCKPPVEDKTIQAMTSGLYAMFAAATHPNPSDVKITAVNLTANKLFEANQVAAAERIAHSESIKNSRG